MSSLGSRASQIAVLLVVLLAGCDDPLPPEAQWLAGRWRWTASCCDFAGQQFIPASPDALVIDLHHNGDAEISDATGNERVFRRTRFEVDFVGGDTLIRFDHPLIWNRLRFRIHVRTMDDIGFIDQPIQCIDCPSTHGFRRVP